jgi:RNA polymerase II-associated factor 1
LAEEERKNYKRVRHPSKRNVELVDATPLLPDLESFPDSGAFVTIKFATNPVQSSTEYDKRLLASLFRPIDRTPAEEEAYEAALEAHTQDPENVPKPQNFMNYEFFLPRSKTTAENFRKKFNVDNPDRDDESLYTDGGCFSFNRVRAYETSHEIEMDHTTKYSHEIILASHDKDDYPKQKAVYYYPVLQKSTIRPQRTKNIARTAGFGEEEEEEKVEQLDLKVEDANEKMLEAMKRYRDHPLGWEEEEEEEIVEEDEDGQQPRRREHSEDADGDDDGVQATRRDSSPRGRRSRSSAEPLDAEGDDED